MDRKNLLLLLLVLLIVNSAVLVNVLREDKIEEIAEEKLFDLCTKDICFKVEIADSPSELEKGLMFRETLEENKGMLFIFPGSSKYGFWMKDTLIPLDIIWISENGTIIYINENTPPCIEDPCKIYSPDEKALYVLEVNAGIVEENNILVGDNIGI